MSDLRYGLMLELESAEQLLAALQRVQGEGYASLETFTPYPIPEMDELLPNRRTTVSLTMLAVAASAAAFAFGFQTWAATSAYPFEVSGTPHLSWPAFLPITFEFGVLLGALSALLSVFFWSRLPRFNHPLFGVPAFRRATIDRFFLVVRSDDPKLDLPSTVPFLESLGGVLHAV